MSTKKGKIEMKVDEIKTRICNIIFGNDGRDEVNVSSISKKIGIKNTTLARILNPENTQVPTLDSLHKIASYYKVSLDYLVYGAEVGPPPPQPAPPASGDAEKIAEKMNKLQTQIDELVGIIKILSKQNSVNLDTIYELKSEIRTLRK